ncbi:1073_t:CDS:2 [Paraglomus brasilianum]|uniref:1073_t:CDS:1 n=1 Tax=Paraglomus brasilianum TaxID=144538 RepID=A0A9N9AAA8_9GLOM|nr:1073_t:CDS:2 [Paraglomus brasilianum]
MLDYKLLHIRYHRKGYKSDEYKAARKIVHLRVAKRLLRLCKINTGVYIKAGQHLASLTYIIPREFTETLAVLQDKAPYRSMEDVERVFKEEFDGAVPSDLFSEFDETPIAAASLAQVHRAKTRDGREAAVKVQYPDVSRLFNVDVWTMQTMSDVISHFFPEFELGWIVVEFKQNLITEFDFENEARNGETTKLRFRHHGDQFSVPQIYWDLTTKRILSMEFIRGVKINDVEGLRSLGADPVWVRNYLLKIFAEMIFCHGIVHCDPHPGNALVALSPTTNKPQLVLLDHGLYRELSDEFRKVYCGLWRALLLNDNKGLKEAAEFLGVAEYVQFLPLIFTQRLPDSLTPLGEDMPDEERAMVHDQLKSVTLNDFLIFLESLPRDMLLVFRTINLLRGIHRELGGNSIESFKINARYATRGFWCETREEEKQRIQKAKARGLSGDEAMVGPVRRWYLFSDAPNIWRSWGFVKDRLYMSIRLRVAELLVRFLRWWYGTRTTPSLEAVV